MDFETCAIIFKNFSAQKTSLSHLPGQKQGIGFDSLNQNCEAFIQFIGQIPYKV